MGAVQARGRPREDAIPVEDGVRLCRLHHRVGRIEPCPETGCPFWETGGAALPGGCLLDRLGLDLQARPGLAHALLQVRRKLEQAVTREDEDEARALFHRLVPAAGSEPD